MRNSVRALQAACFLGVGMLFGCVSTVPPASQSVTPLRVTASDVPLIAALMHEQDRHVETCETRKSCPQDHYVRGLLALFHSREQAVGYFQQVQGDAPHSRLANWSSSWVELLQTSPTADVSKVTEDLIWEVLERELSETSNEPVRRLWSDRAQRVGILQRPAAISLDQGSILEAKDQTTVHALRKQLRERERNIMERDHQIRVLSSQLEALKQIDHETLTKRRSLHTLKK
jgi:hypothetical protein